MTLPVWNDAACTTTVGSTAAIAAAAASGTDKVDLTRDKARRTPEQRRARIAGGAQPIEAIAIASRDRDRHRLGCGRREIERDTPGKVAGSEDQDVGATVGHDV